jgi:Copper transport outer membrane protein, MctB
MVSFRFHLVSLVAVFLALGMGVLAGTTVINQGLVRRLRAQTAEFERDAASQAAELDMWRGFGEQVMAYVVEDRLIGADVVMVTQDGTDEALIAAARRVLEQAGADLLGLLSVSERMALQDDSSRASLAVIVDGLATDDPETLTTEAAEGMAEELAFGAEGAEILPELIREEFVVVRGREFGDSVVGSLDGDEAVVVVAGGREPAVVDPNGFLVPLVEGLVTDGARVAAAESLVTRYPFVTLLREDAGVNGEISTQDNVDQVPGQAGLVLGVQDLLRGSPGHYGVKDGASELLPPP